MPSDSFFSGLFKDAVDIHVHPAPSPFPRRLDIVDAVDNAAEAGFRGLVAKSHHHATTTDVATLERRGEIQAGFDVMGGICLNGSVGGLNPRAVDLALAMGGRMVWLPTIAAPRHIEHHGSGKISFPTSAVSVMPEAPVDVFDAEGKLVPEVYEILELIRDADAVLASGHIGPAAVTAVFEAAREVGVRGLVVNHPNFILDATFNQVRYWVTLGAKIEHTLCLYDEASIFYQLKLENLVEWIPAIGPQHSILSSDLGQMNNPLPTECFRRIVGGLVEKGFGESELRHMLMQNPSELLALK